MERSQLIETVTREVLAILGAGGEATLGLDHADEAVANGVARLGFSGNGCDVPTGLAQYIHHTVLKADVPPENRQHADHHAAWHGACRASRA